MSLAENLLNNMENDFAEYLQEDLEPHIVIDESRIANVPQSLRTIAVTGDKDILTIPFDCARFIDGHDLSTFAIYLNYVLPDGTDGTYIPDSITTSDGDGEYHFDWLIKNNITKTNGKISFAITAIKTKQNDAGESVVDKQWSSIPNGDCSIALGLDISNIPTEEETPDVVAQLSAILERIHRDVDEWIKNVLVQTTGNNTAKAMSQDAVTKELDKKIDKSSVSQSTGTSDVIVMSQKATTDGLEKILSDSKGYTDSRENELNKKHNSNLEKISKNSKRITNTEEVLDVVLDETIEYSKNVPNDALPYAEITKVGGMTYRDEATNTLKNAGVTKIKAIGKNLLPYPYYSQSNTSQGITFAVNANGSITVKGTCIADTSFALFIGKIHLIGSVRLAGVLKGSGTTYYLQPYFNDKAASAVYSGPYTYAEDLSKTGLTRLMLFVKAGAVIDETIYPMLSYASLGVIEYEQYRESVLEIPEAVQALDGYGFGTSEAVYNYIDYEKKRFVKSVECLDMGVLNFELGSNNTFYTVIGDKASGGNMLADIYPTYIGDFVANAPNNTCGYNRTHAGTFYIKTTDYTDAEAFNASLAGKKLYYELAGPIITDISELISYDNFIEVSEGGLVIAENENGLASPTTIIYRKDNTVKKENDGSIYVGNIRLSPSDLSKLLGLIN